MNSLKIYAKTSPRKLFLIAAIPGAISMLAASLWGLFDGMFVGQILGEEAFAAVNLAFPIVFINFSLADLIGVGSAVPISILLGKREEKEANNYFTCACLMIIIVGVGIGALLYATAPQLVKIMGAEGNLADLSIRYIRVYALSSPFSTMVFAVDNFLRICGKVKSSMALNILMSVLIVILEFLCLSVFNMGISGSAFAVSLGMFLCTVVALVPFWRKKYQLRFCKPSFSFRMVRQIVFSGTPNFLSNVAGRITSIILNVVLLRLGGANAVNIYGVLMFAGEIFQPLLYGVCDSLQPAIGYNWGAGDKKRVVQIEKYCIFASAVISIGATLIMFFFPAQVIGLFLKESDPSMLTMAIHALKLFSLTFLTRWFGFAVQSFLIALDKPLPASILSVTNAFIFPLLLIALLWPFGLNGIWLNFALTSALVSILSGAIIIRMRKTLK